MKTTAQISDVRIIKGQMFATVTGKAACQLAKQYGVKMRPSRFWFTAANWEAFKTAVSDCTKS